MGNQYYIVYFFLAVVSANAQTNQRTLGNKSYELSNHLGNVMAVVSDRKTPTQETAANTVAFNETDIKSFNDYYPYGMVLENRNGSSNYRFGFQGQEKDDEVKGSNNSINYKYRVHDPRLGRFFAVDPLSAKYPHYSSYQFSGNKTTAYVELEGLEESETYDKEYLKEREIETTYSYNHDNNPMDFESPNARNPIVEAVPIYSRVSNKNSVNKKLRQEGWLVRRKFKVKSNDQLVTYKSTELDKMKQDDLKIINYFGETVSNKQNINNENEKITKEEINVMFKDFPHPFADFTLVDKVNKLERNFKSYVSALNNSDVKVIHLYYSLGYFPNSKEETQKLYGNRDSYGTNLKNTLYSLGLNKNIKLYVHPEIYFSKKSHHAYKYSFTIE